MLVVLDDLRQDMNARPNDRAKARLFLEIDGDEGATRKKLVERLRMRPGTVSLLVGELIEEGLVAEGPAHGASRKGRPEIPLRVVPSRLAALVLHVVSEDVRAVLVDMAGRVIAEDLVRLDRADADNGVLLAASREAAERLLGQVPSGTEVCGLAVSVPGIVDAARGSWVYSSRWPRMCDATFEELARSLGLPVRLDRNLNVELRARLLRRPEERQGSMLFVHWGYGVGSACARDGQIVTSGLGGFAEFGHWNVSPHSRRRCRCGRAGCLETEAALWALLPGIRAEFPEAPMDEWAFERFLRETGVANIPGMEKAIAHFALALSNLYLAFFPDRIVVTGPFVQQKAIAGQVEQRLLRCLPEFARRGLTFRPARAGVDDEIVGSALPVFGAALKRLLAAGNNRVSPEVCRS